MSEVKRESSRQSIRELIGMMRHATAATINGRVDIVTKKNVETVLTDNFSITRRDKYISLSSYGTGLTPLPALDDWLLKKDEVNRSYLGTNSKVLGEVRLYVVESKERMNEFSAV